MAVSNPVKVPEKQISSLNVKGFAGGLYLNGEQNADANQIVAGEDVELTIDGFLVPRKSLQSFLPDTVETTYEKYPALVESEIFYFTADDNKIKFCQQTDSEWTDCGGDNTITTQNGGKPTFIRALNALLILNGSNGDKLAYVDLDSPTFDIVKYDLVDDPTSALTAVAAGITLVGDYKIYYGYTYSSATGETLLSPILEQSISKPRDNWDPEGTEYLTLTRPDFGAEPAGATYWNLYIALAANGGSIQTTDMLMLAGGLDLNQEKIIDNGTLAIDIGRGNPPAVNSTDGPRADHGIETNGRPILYGIKDEDGNDTGDILIGGDGEFALDFSSANGGFRSQPAKGTNYYPASVIGFRNGQGIPSLTILFSNTQGLSKQATLEQQTINYGNQSFVVWGVTEQNYGAAGVASTYGVVNYQGQLSFPSTDGFLSMDTAPALQNVLATKKIDKDIEPYAHRVKVSALKEIVGTGWNNRVFWIVPARGFDTPTEILIRDLNNNGVWNPPLRIPAQWIGTVSPPDSPAFVYISQGNKTFKLFDSFGTVDYKGGAADTFATSARGALMGINDAHNAFQAVVQAVFYVMNFIGEITVGVNYRDQNGKIKTKTKTVQGAVYQRSYSGGWDDPQFAFDRGPSPAGWDAGVEMDQSTAALDAEDVRIRVPINDLASEVQWFYLTPDDYCNYLMRVISFEGENLGVKPDLR